MPETISSAQRRSGGGRRHKPYSYSVDLGKNWFVIEGLPNSLYQPFMLPLGNGSVINFGHFGGDIAFGQADMFIGADIFSIGDNLPSSCNLQIERRLAEDKSHYENRYRACLTCAGKPLANQQILSGYLPVGIKTALIHNPRRSILPYRGRRSPMKGRRGNLDSRIQPHRRHSLCLRN